MIVSVPYDEEVPYDEDLADRIRELIGGESRLTEHKMFGGLAVLIGGNMALAASGEGGMLVRVDQEVEALSKDLFGWVDTGPPRRNRRMVSGMVMFEDVVSSGYRIT